MEFTASCICTNFVHPIASNKISIFGDTASQPNILPANYEDRADNSKEKLRLLRLQHRRLRLATLGGSRHRALAQTIDNTRGLDINSHLSAEAHTKDLRFHRHQQHDNPNNARGLDNNFASDHGCDSTTSTRRPL
jgi:hypothetical protein